jgi:hypothetical protein
VGKLAVPLRNTIPDVSESLSSNKNNLLAALAVLKVGAEGGDKKLASAVAKVIPDVAQSLLSDEGWSAAKDVLKVGAKSTNTELASVVKDHANCCSVCQDSNVMYCTGSACSWCRVRN